MPKLRRLAAAAAAVLASLTVSMPARAIPDVGATNPSGIAFDAGSLRVAEAGKGRLQRVAPDGIQITAAANLLTGGFTRGLTGVAVDGGGVAYVAIAETGEVRFVTPGGASGVYARGLGSPNGLAFDAAGNLYAADQAGKRILKVTPAREIQTVVGGFAQAPFGVALDAVGDLFVTTQRDGKIWRVVDGAAVQYGSLSGTAEGLAFAADGTLFVGDGQNGRVMRFQPPDPGFPPIGLIERTGVAGPLNLAFDGTRLHVAAQGDGSGTVKDKVTSTDVGRAGLPLQRPTLQPTALPPAPQTVVHADGGVALDPAPYLGVLPQATMSAVGTMGAFEPTIGVSDTGAVFVNPKPTASINRRYVMRSTDQGKTWTDVSPGVPPGVTVPPTDLDPYLYVDRDTGRVFTVDLYAGCSYMWYSDDDATTWIPNAAACGIPGNDHQTISSGPTRTLPTVGYPNAVYYCYNIVAFAGCGRSLDGGLTFEAAGTAYPPGSRCVAPSSSSALTGHVAVGGDGTVYLPMANCIDGPSVAISKTDGATWQVVQVAGPSFIGSDHESHVAVDGAGTAYYVWAGAPNRTPYLAVSKDAGLSWGTPIRIGPPGLTEAALPTLDAGDKGKIALQYLGSFSDCCYAKTRGGETTWHNVVTISTNADGAEPVFMTTTFNPLTDPVRRATCGPGRCGERPAGVGDFIELIVDPFGRTWGSVVDTCITTCGSGGVAGSNNAERMFAGQLVRGPKLIGSGMLEPPPWFAG